MTHRHTALIAALALAGAAALAGCTPNGDEPTPTDSPAASATPTEEAAPEPGDPAPTQEAVPVPESEEEAIAQATEVVQRYLELNFDLQRDPDLGMEYVEQYVIPQSGLHQVLEDTIKTNRDEGKSVEGEPVTWSTREDLSYAAPSTNAATGEEYEFGGVVLLGCADNTKTTFTTDGEPNESSSSKVFPAEVRLVYVAEAGTWLLSELTSLSGDGEAHSC